MKTTAVSWFASLMLIAVAAGSCFGQRKADPQAMSAEEIKARIAEAHAKDKRLIVTMKDGSTISGTVIPGSNGGFTLTDRHVLFGGGDSVTMRYSDVELVKGRNPVAKVLKKAGEKAATVAILPFFIIAALLGLVPDC